MPRRINISNDPGENVGRTQSKSRPKRAFAKTSSRYAERSLACSISLCWIRSSPSARLEFARSPPVLHPGVAPIRCSSPARQRFMKTVAPLDDIP
jgi:hypothetical protein